MGNIILMQDIDLGLSPVISSIHSEIKVIDKVIQVRIQVIKIHKKVFYLREQSVENPWDDWDPLFSGRLEAAIAFSFLDVEAIAGFKERFSLSILFPELKIYY